VAQVGADVAMMCLARRHSFEQLRAVAALGFRGRKALGLIDAGVLVDSVLGWDPPFVYHLLDLTDFTHRDRLNDLLAVPGGNRPEDNLKEIGASHAADGDEL